MMKKYLTVEAEMFDEDRSKLIGLAAKSEISDVRIKAALQTLQGEDVKPMGEGFMSVKDAMVFLGGISRVHLWQCRIKKGLPSHMVGNRVVFLRKELSDWVMKGAKA